MREREKNIAAFSPISMEKYLMAWFVQAIPKRENKDLYAIKKAKVNNK